MIHKSKSILVTGGAGFIGFHVAKKLLENNYEVIIIDNFNDYYDPQIKYDRINQIKNNKNLTIYASDISDMESIEKIFKENQIDQICHLAAQAGVRYSIENPYVYEESNLKGFINILECAIKSKIDNIVFASSSSVYGDNKMKKNGFCERDRTHNPISLYGATKKANELIAHAYHKIHRINFTGLRFFTVYGPWGRPDMALFKFTKNIMENKPIDVYNNGKMQRDFTYIDDIVDGIFSSLDKNFGFEIFNLGNSNTIKLKYFIELIEKELNKKAKINFLSMQQGDVKKTFANISKAQQLLNFQPKTNVEDGIKKFIDWYKQYYNVE